MFDTVADQAFKLWGLHGTSLIATLVLISMVSQLLAKLIPEDSTGWLCWVRKIAKVVGLYAANRITTGITVTDVAKAAVHSGAVSVESVKAAQAEVPPEPVVPPQQVEPAPEPLELKPEDRLVTPAFPGYQRPQDSEGHFLPLEGEQQ